MILNYPLNERGDQEREEERQENPLLLESVFKMQGDLGKQVFDV